MIIPLRTDRPPRRTPVVTQAIILINVAIYVVGLIGQSFNAFSVATLVNHGHFDPQHFIPWQLFTSLFLHDPSSIWHLVFNMLFLWVFGPPVEDRLGRVGFLCFYLMGGALANLAHMMIETAPVIGASGAIAAVSGSFLALHPRSRIICFFLIGFGTMAIPSLLFIALYFLIDVLRQTMSMFGATMDNVAYMAHIAGYIFGFALGFALLGTGVVPRDDYDVFFLFKQWRRRSALRQLNRRSPPGVFESASADTGDRLARAKLHSPMTDAQRREADLRMISPARPPSTGSCSPSRPPPSSSRSVSSNSPITSMSSTSTPRPRSGMNCCSNTTPRPPRPWKYGSSSPSSTPDTFSSRRRLAVSSRR